MIKVLRKFIIFILLVSFMMGLAASNKVYADWWQRPDERVTPPILPRDENPTSSPPEPTSFSPLPTSTSSQPTPTLVTVTSIPGQPSPTTVGRIGGVGSSDEDPCASGKSFSGDYCGWSPSTVNQGGTGKSNTILKIASGPPVLGLSYTSGPDLTLSDIMLFTGILCIGLYLRSKLTIRNHQYKKSLKAK